MIYIDLSDSLIVWVFIHKSIIPVEIALKNNFPFTCYWLGITKRTRVEQQDAQGSHEAHHQQIDRNIWTERAGAHVNDPDHRNENKKGSEQERAQQNNAILDRGLGHNDLLIWIVEYMDRGVVMLHDRTRVSRLIIVVRCDCFCIAQTLTAQLVKLEEKLSMGLAWNEWALFALSCSA